MLELKNITKLFPGVRALDDVSIAFQEGEVHALIGENGAGKSTLMKIICGIYQPDAGEILIDAQKVRFKNFQEAVANEINIVNQEIQVIPEYSVAENICLERIGAYKKHGRIDWNAVNEEAKKNLEIVGLNLDPTEKIAKLTVAQKQQVQIAKAISSKAKYLLLDEPTSSLTRYETENLFGIIRNLKEQGVCIIFISHKIEELFEVSDKITVLRDGQYVGTKNAADTNRDEIVRMMLGRNETSVFRGFLKIEDKNVLEVEKLSDYRRFWDISFCLKKGEILGWYGLVGSGRSEIAKAIIGERRCEKGKVRINKEKANIKSVSDSLYRYNMGYITENRKEEGLMLAASVEENIGITIWSRLLNRFRKIDRQEEARIVKSMIEELDIKCPSSKTKVLTLSGGNQQKVSIAKWIAAQCDILIIDEPTVGVDIGAKEYIHDLIWKLAEEYGKSIILISSDLPELVSLSRRILVFREGKIRGELSDLNEIAYSYEEISERIGEQLM